MSKRFIFSVDVDHFPKSDIGIGRILDILDKKDIKTMFFVAGKFAEEYKQIIKEVHLKGHEIGCHGYSHGLDVSENFVDLDLNEQHKRVQKSSKILKEITGEDVKIFRAPYAKINHNTLNILEKMGYLCDSSVTSMRYDFGMGVSNNIRAFFAPAKPYNPSRDNIYKKGDSAILEIPISAFLVPLTLSALRTLDMKKVKFIFNMSLHFFDPVVFYVHPWEVMAQDEIQLWEGLPKRHTKNRGEKALTYLEMFLDHVEKRCEFTQFREILESG